MNRRKKGLSGKAVDYFPVTCSYYSRHFLATFYPHCVRGAGDDEDLNKQEFLGDLQAKMVID